MVSVRALLVATAVIALLAPAGATGLAAGDVEAPDSTVGALDRGRVAGTSLARAPETDNSVTRIAVQQDGDARWTVTIRTRLETDEDVEKYRAFQKRFRENTSQFLNPFADRMSGVVAESSNVTGREMAAENFSASTSIQEVPRRWGVVSFTFTWTNFAADGGDALVVGDVFEGGFFLAEGDTLIVEAPSGYAVRSADPEPGERTDGAVTWTGREDFADRRPRVELAPAGTGSTTPTASATATPSGPGTDDASGRLLLVAGAIAAVLTGLVALITRHPDLPSALRRGGAGARPDADTSESDVPVMTDAEKIESLLAEHGGRMKQADVAAELDWSASKTSRVVGDMVEDGRVEKLRVGRENVLDLPE